jgi:hypothetical protein
MARTKNPIEAIIYAKRFIKNMPIETVQTEIINRVHAYMWMYAPWRWTIGSMPTFNLSANQQDYTIAYPSDFLYTIEAFLSDGSLDERPLWVEPILEPNVGFVGQVNHIAYMGNAGDSAGLVRVMPRPAQINGTQTVIAKYKKAFTPYTNQTIFSALMPFDDEWFSVFEEGVLWQAYLYADDRRAGGAQADPNSGQIRFSDQRANFEAALVHMREREKLGVVNIFERDQREVKK